MVKKHPETEFYFFLPPYSELWWDSVYRSGQTEEYLYARQAAMEALIAYDNVQIYDFQTDEDIILNLDYYMDPIHFSADVNQFMVVKAKEADVAYLVTKKISLTGAVQCAGCQRRSQTGSRSIYTRYFPKIFRV